MMENTGGTGGDELLFDAVLHPNRSLGRTGFAVLMGGVALICALAGLGFWLAGAWPITGFFGLDVALLYFAFRANYRSARLTERVRLTRDLLTVRRVEASGRERSWRFQPYWLRVEVENARGDDRILSLTSHGRRLIIGAFLSPEERSEFARVLRAALARCRCLPAPIA